MNSKGLKVLVVIFILIIIAHFTFIIYQKSYSWGSCDYSKYRYLNCELGCNSKLVVDKRAYATLKEKVKSLIKNSTDDGDVSTVSVYLRDLENGPTLCINEHEQFVPASLL